MQWWLELFLCRVALNLSVSFKLVHLVQRDLDKKEEEFGPGMFADAASRPPPQASPWPSKVVCAMPSIAEAYLRPPRKAGMQKVHSVT